MPEEQNIPVADARATPPADPSFDPHAPHRAGARADRDIFCAHCQTVTKHACSVDANKEVLSTCDVCGRALKFPFPDHAEHLAQMLAAHHESNVGQISAEATQAERDKIDADFLKLMGVSAGTK